MKARKAAIPIFLLATSLAAIYLVPRRSPYTHIAAAIVLVASVLAIAQAVRAARAAELARPRLANLASSSRQWKDAVRMVVARVAAAEGYLVHRVLADAANFDDPAGGRIFVFVSDKNSSGAPNGLLVVTPDDFAALSRLETGRLEQEIRLALFDHWGTARLARHRPEIVARIADTAARLYSLQFFGVGFRVAIGPDVSGGLQARVGPFDLEFSREELEHLIELPYIQMNLRILEALGKIDSSVERFVASSAYGKAAD